MKLKIITLLLLIGLALHGYSQNSGFIEIKHTGISDKPIWTILIATQYINIQDNELLKTTIVDNFTYSQIKKFITNYNYSMRRKILGTKDYGTFTIIIGDANKKPMALKTYELLAIVISRGFFKDFINYCKSNNIDANFINQLQTTANRIKPY